MKLTRRQVLGGLGFARYIAAQSDEDTSNMLAGVWLEPFVDPLPVPRVLAPTARNGDVERYRIEISEFRQKLHRDLPLTTVWGFEGAMPGPTIGSGERGARSKWNGSTSCRRGIGWRSTIVFAEPEKMFPRCAPPFIYMADMWRRRADGYPDDWVTPGNSQKTIYPNRQPGASSGTTIIRWASRG